MDLVKHVVLNEFLVNKIGVTTRFLSILDF